MKFVYRRDWSQLLSSLFMKLIREEWNHFRYCLGVFRLLQELPSKLISPP